jgi:hypothetical protein
MNFKYKESEDVIKIVKEVIKLVLEEKIENEIC